MLRVRPLLKPHLQQSKPLLSNHTQHRLHLLVQLPVQRQLLLRDQLAKLPLFLLQHQLLLLRVLNLLRLHPCNLHRPHQPNRLLHQLLHHLHRQRHALRSLLE